MGGLQLTESFGAGGGKVKRCSANWQRHECIAPERRGSDFRTSASGV
jgi:hypothetical protein